MADQPKRGDKVTIHGSDPYVFRVMAVADGYAMLRYPHCAPFVEPVKSLRVATGDEETTHGS